MFVAIQSVLAIVLVISIGFFAGKKMIVPLDISKPLADFVIRFTFPALLFTTTLSFKVSEIFNLKYLLIFFVTLFLPYISIILIRTLFFRSSIKVATLASINCTTPNLAFMGIPYLTQVLGINGLLPVVMGTFISSVMMMPITITLLERDVKGKTLSIWGRIKSSIITAISNPLVLAPLLGVACSISNFYPPHFIVMGLKILGSATSPVALFTLGLMMVKFHFIFSKEAVFNIIFKLFLQPIIPLLLFLIFYINGVVPKGIVILAAMPTGVLMSMFAEKYGVYEKETVSSIIGSTVLSVFSLVLFTILVNSYL